MIRAHSNMDITGTTISPYARFSESSTDATERADSPSNEDEFPLHLGGIMDLKQQEVATTELTALDRPTSHDCHNAWQLNYRDAAIYLEEGINNDKFTSHPKTQQALPTYMLVHNHWYYCMDFIASLILILLALTEKPAHPVLEFPVGVHSTVELLSLTVIGAELILKLRWLGWKTSATHTRTAIKATALFIMLIEAVVVLIRQSSHLRVTRAVRPIFLVDNHYCRRVRRYLRQVLQSLPPTLDMLGLLLFIILLFSCLGFYLFSGYAEDPYFSTLETSFISLFVLLTTANYPDVMMPAYSRSRWNALFFVVYLVIVLYFMMNLLLAVVYASFSMKEKEKLKKLLLHRRAACQHAFHLLLSREHHSSVTFRRFAGLMTFLCPTKSRRDVYLTFRLLNVSRSGELTLPEFQHVLDTLSMTWKKKEDPRLYFSSFPKLPRIVCSLIRKLVLWEWTQYFIYLVILSGGLSLMIRTWIISNNGSVPFGATGESIFFVVFYNIEAALKLIGLGPHEYFRSGWNVFDFIVVLLSNFGMILESFGHFGWMIVRHARLLRVFKAKKRYRDVFGTVFMLADGLASAAVVLLLLYYFFAIVGMEIFSGYDMVNCCKNSSVESNYIYDNATQTFGYYYLNNFENIVTSYVTLFELTVVNNWYIIMNGYAYVATEWSRIYFMGFYIITMVFLNVVIVSVIDGFIFRIQYKSSMSKDEEEKMISHEVMVTREEMEDAGLRSKASHEESAVYIGSSRLTRNVRQAIMYHTEIENWLSSSEITESGSHFSFSNYITSS